MVVVAGGVCSHVSKQYPALEVSQAVPAGMSQVVRRRLRTKLYSPKVKLNKGTMELVWNSA